MNDQTTAVALTRSRLSEVAMDQRGSSGFVLHVGSLADVAAVGELMARSSYAVPKHLRDNPGACSAVAMRAFTWEMDPWAVATKTYLVNDQLAYEAQLVAAVVINRAPIAKRPKYVFEGEDQDLRCTVTIEMQDGDLLEYKSPRVGKIPTKNSPLWKADPEQQIGYFAIRAWARRHTPDVIMGVYTPDEMREQQIADVETVKSFGALEARAVDAQVLEGEVLAPEAPKERRKAAKPRQEAAVDLGEPVPNAAPDNPTAASATPASTDSPEATSSQTQPAEPSDDGAKDSRDFPFGAAKSAGAQTEASANSQVQENTQTASSRSDADDFPGDRPATPGSAQAPEDLFEEAAGSLRPLLAYADAIAGARDWAAIRAALGDLTRAPAWKGFPAAQQSTARKIAYARLRELNAGGYSFDFIDDPQAFRCYIEVETDEAVMRANRDAMARGEAFMNLNTDAKIAMDRAFDTRVAALRGSVQPTEYD